MLCFVWQSNLHIYLYYFVHIHYLTVATLHEINRSINTYNYVIKSKSVGTVLLFIRFFHFQEILIFYQHSHWLSYTRKLHLHSLAFLTVWFLQKLFYRIRISFLHVLVVFLFAFFRCYHHIFFSFNFSNWLGVVRYDKVRPRPSWCCLVEGGCSGYVKLMLKGW